MRRGVKGHLHIMSNTAERSIKIRKLYVFNNIKALVFCLAGKVDVCTLNYSSGTYMVQAKKP